MVVQDSGENSSALWVRDSSSEEERRGRDEDGWTGLVKNTSEGRLMLAVLKSEKSIFCNHQNPETTLA